MEKLISPKCLIAPHLNILRLSQKVTYFQVSYSDTNQAYHLFIGVPIHFSVHLMKVKNKAAIEVYGNVVKIHYSHCVGKYNFLKRNDDIYIIKSLSVS